jgi:hypothetical protein
MSTEQYLRKGGTRLILRGLSVFQMQGIQVARPLHTPLIALALCAVMGLSAAWAEDTTTSAAAATAPPATTTPTPPPRTLDLAPPDIRKVVPGDQLDTPLPDENSDADDQEYVSVKSQRAAPDVPGGIASLWWGLWHPTQAWRLLTPVPGP